MKANELRIGNLAIDMFTKELLICCGIYCEPNGSNAKIEFSVLDRTKYPLPNGWKAEPIRLTEEWLLKFGYDLITENHYAISGHLIWICNDLFICDKNGIILKHVHQLQNLYFALTNEEL